MPRPKAPPPTAVQWLLTRFTPSDADTALFLRVPKDLLRGRVLSYLNRVHPDLGVFFLLLLDLQEGEDRLITAGPKYLAFHMRLADSTIRQLLRLCVDGAKAQPSRQGRGATLALPKMLRRLPDGKRYTFRESFLEWVVQTAFDTVAPPTPQEVYAQRWRDNLKAHRFQERARTAAHARWQKAHRRHARRARSDATAKKMFKLKPRGKSRS